MCELSERRDGGRVGWKDDKAGFSSVMSCRTLARDWVGIPREIVMRSTEKPPKVAEGVDDAIVKKTAKKTDRIDKEEISSCVVYLETFIYVRHEMQMFALTHI